MLNKKSLINECKRYLFMVLACISFASSLAIFLLPNKIVGGSISGLASLIELKTTLPAGVFIVLINIPILLFGLKLMGWMFIFRCFITTTALGFFTEVCKAVAVTTSLTTLTDDPILASLYGGVLQGIGIGLFIKYEMSSGGTELLGRLTHHVLPFGTIATHVAIFDGFIMLLGSILLPNLENILHALILIFVSAKVSDLVVFGFSSAKLCYIITTKAEEVADFLISHSPRGVTFIQGEGMYSKTPKGVLFTCVKSNQVVALKKMIKLLDEDAFVIVCQANEVYGKGFNRIK
jgi:uncharacterized membrane-anchored protein YitT (DUF2179 family)